jgi:hypothetical protein
MAIDLGKYHDSLNLQGDVTPAIRFNILVFFNNSILYELVKIVHREFMAKALRGADSLGNKWAPLSPKLEAWKRKTKRPIIRIGTEPLINIRYGQLEKALRPGRFSGGKYQPRSNQRAFVTPQIIDFECTVSYAEEVQSVRPFIPDELEPWLDEAAELSIPRLQRYVRSIKNSR